LISFLVVLGYEHVVFILPLYQYRIKPFEFFPKHFIFAVGQRINFRFCLPKRNYETVQPLDFLVQCFVLAAGLLQVDAVDDALVLEFYKLVAQVLHLGVLLGQCLNFVLFGVCKL